MGNGAMLFEVLRANVLLVDIEHFGLTIIHRGGAINIVANENTDRNNNIELCALDPFSLPNMLLWLLLLCTIQFYIL